jgi:hypothetical protein
MRTKKKGKRIKKEKRTEKGEKAKVVLLKKMD